MGRLRSRDGISIGLLWAAFILLTSGAAPASAKVRDERAADLRPLWAEAGESVAELPAGKNSSREQQVNVSVAANWTAGTSQPAAEPELGEASSNESTSYGPMLELNAFQAAERGLFRHSTSASVIVTIAYALVFVIGLIGNSFVVAIVCKSPRMRTVTNYFIANLALADILVLLFCLPATLVGNLFIPYVLGEWVCKTVSYLQGVAVSASINTMMTVTLDRFLAICFPMDWHMSRRTARRVIACIWLFSLTISLPWALFFKLAPYPHETIMLELCVEVWPTARWGKIYFVLANLVLLYLFPAVVITFCYLGIWYKIERRNIPGDQPKGLKIELIMQKSKLKVIKMMMLVVLIFLLSWFPTYVIFVRLKLFESNDSELEDWIIQNTMPFAQWLGASNSCINPILYTFFNRKYKRGLIDLLRCAFCCRPPSRMGAKLSDQSRFDESGTSRPLKYEHSQGRGRRGHHSRAAQNGGLSMVSLNATPVRSSNGRPTCLSTTMSTEVHTSNNGHPSSRHCEQTVCERMSEALKVESPRQEQSVDQAHTKVDESPKHHSKRSRGPRQVPAVARRKHQCGCRARRRTKSTGTRSVPQEHLLKVNGHTSESAPVAAATLSSSTPILGCYGEASNLLAASSHEPDEGRTTFIGSHRVRASGSCSLHHCRSRRDGPPASESAARSDCFMDRRHRKQPLLSGVDEDEDDDEDSKAALSIGECGWTAGKRSSCDEQPRRQSDNSNNSNAYGQQIGQIKRLEACKRAVSRDAVSVNVLDCALCNCTEFRNITNKNLAATDETRFVSEGQVRHVHKHSHGRHHQGHRHRRHTCSKSRDLERREGASRGSQSHDCVNTRAGDLADNVGRVDATSLADDSGLRSFHVASKESSGLKGGDASGCRKATRGDPHGRLLNNTNTSTSTSTTNNNNNTTKSTEVTPLRGANQMSSLICMDSISLGMEPRREQSKHINLADDCLSSAGHTSRSQPSKAASALDESVESSPEGHVLAITDSDLDDSRHDAHCERRARCSGQKHELDDSRRSTDVFGADEDGSTTGDHVGPQEEEEEDEEEDLLFGSGEDSPSRQTRMERLRIQQRELDEQLRKKQKRTQEAEPACQWVAKAPQSGQPVSRSQRQSPIGRASCLIVGGEISGYQVAIMSLAASSSNLANLAMQKLSSSCKFVRRRTTSGCERTATKRGSLSPSGLNKQPLVSPPEPRGLLSEQNGH